MIKLHGLPTILAKGFRVFINLGIRDEYPGNLKKRIKLTNWIMLISTLAGFGGAANAGFTMLSTSILSVNILVYAAMIPLLVKGRHVAARMLYILWSVCSIIGQIAVEGYMNSAEYFALLPAMGAFLLFGEEEKKYRNIVLIPTLILTYIPAYLAVKHFQGFSHMATFQSPAQTEAIRLVAFSITLVCLILAVQFLVKENRRAELNIEEAAKVVEEKKVGLEIATNNLKSILAHIPQGILSIDSKGNIGGDHSLHLMQLLEESSLAGRNLKTVLLDRCVLKPDECDRIYQSLVASIGEPEISFEVNAGHFPSQLIYRVGDRLKFLELTWSPRIENGDVRDVLLTLLDITAQKELEEVSNAYREEMQIVQELLSQSPETMVQFFSTSEAMLHEVRDIFSSMKLPHDKHAIRLMFVNLHTIKGAARTLNLCELSEAVHKMESYYAELLMTGKSIDMSRIVRDYDETSAVFEKYRMINRDKLNRVSDFSNVVLDRDFLEKHWQLLRQKLPTSIPGGRNDFQTQLQTLRRMLFWSLRDRFDNYRNMSGKVARDLGKLEPDFFYSMPDVYLPPEQIVAFDKIMLHILRNALDHGIESSEERLKKAKPASGSIRIVGHCDAQLLDIQIEDDGRGLDIPYLRKASLDKGLIHEGSGVEDVARTIFEPGISSARLLSEVSGRGMGMNAVQTFLEKEKGRIFVEIVEQGDDPNVFVPFRLRIQLPVNDDFT